MMDFQIKLDYVFHGEIADGSSTFPAIISVRHPDQVWKVVLERSDFVALAEKPWQLKGMIEKEAYIWCPDFQVTGLFDLDKEKCVLEGLATLFFYGDLPVFNNSKGEIICNVTISPTILLSPRSDEILNKDGTIAFMEEEPQIIHWKTRRGTAELIASYDYQRTKIDSMDALIRRQKCQITLKMSILDGELSLESLFVELENILNESLLLISFLSRKSVIWFEARIDFHPSGYIEDDMHYVHIIFQSQKTDKIHFSMGTRHRTPVNLQYLREEGFQSMLHKFEESPIRNRIQQAIHYLLAFFEIEHFEARIGLIYAALESLVDGLSKYHNIAYSMGSSKFDKLSKVLEATIQEKIPNENTAKDIIGKLPELRRPAIRNRLVELIRIYKLDRALIDLTYSPLEDIKAEDILNEIIESILHRRNIYIHTGVANYEEQYEDCFFLLELMELWILQLLECPDIEINADAFTYVINWWMGPQSKRQNHRRRFGLRP